jgi:hypothetical protein
VFLVFSFTRSCYSPSHKSRLSIGAKEKCPKIYSKDLVEVLFLSPYCKIRLLEDYNIAKRQAASEYLKELERQAFLESEKVGRDLYFLNRPFLELLIS